MHPKSFVSNFWGAVQGVRLFLVSIEGAIWINKVI